jgi:uncharacterized protein YgbK (DUF1537 family)
VLVVTASQRTIVSEQLRSAQATHGLKTDNVVFSVDESGDAQSTYAAPGPSGHLKDSAVMALRATVDAGLNALSPSAARRVADQVTARLGGIVSDLAVERPPSALIIFGGDTAYGVLKALGARGIVLHAEPLPGVPVGTIAGGQLDGTLIATKAGAFGDDRTLSRLLDSIKDS